MMPGSSMGIFGYDSTDNSGKPRFTRFAEIIDGLSNTLLMSEILVSGDNDADNRGDVVNDDHAGPGFMTLNTPNTTVSDVNDCIVLADPLMPCIGGGNKEMAARSRHTGGVNAVLGDGSVRIEQTIYVERESQRKIVLGKGGQTIKAIGSEARREIAGAIEAPVHLMLFVKVREDWGDDPERYREMGLEFPND